MEELLTVLLWSALEFALIGTGALVVRIVSAGRVRGERLHAREGRIHGGAGALWFRREGQWVVTATGLLFVGLVFYVSVAVLAFWG